MREILTGKTEKHLFNFENVLIHKEIVEPLKQLKESAALEGIDIKIASGFRSYERQLSIWNNKALGKRTLLDENSLPLDFKSLSPERLAHVIMRWSAIPGTSRHHWGTDLDIYDANALPSSDYQLQLIPSEYEEYPFKKLHEWLQFKIENDESFGFFLPYKEDRGGVSKEPWHISYGPLSEVYLEQFDFDLFYEVISNGEIKLSQVLMNEAHDIYERYIKNITKSLE